MTRTTSEAATRQARSADALSPLARGFRAAMLLLVVTAGCYVAFGFGRLWREWRQASQPIDVPLRAEFDPGLLEPALPLEGPWSFAQLDWDIRSQIVTRADVSARFENPMVVAGAANDEQLPDVSQELIEIAESLGVRPIEQVGNRVYQLDRPNLKAQLLVRLVATKPKVVSLAAAFPHSNDQWQLLELTPRGSTENIAAARPQLLPLPPGARREGGRFANDGQALLELISLDSRAEELLSLWKAAGWEVRPSGVGSPNEFSYLCARGNDVVYAWSADDHTSVRNLMLVRTPSGPDTKASER